MDIFDAICQRRSTRSYREETPSRTKLEKLIGSAQQAPCAFNRQAWRFTVVTDKALLNEISVEAKLFMTRNRPIDLPEALYGKLADPDFHIFYHAPALILISAESTGPWLETDCALAGQNLMLAAAAEGLGACWIGLCQPFLETAEGRARIGLSPGERAFAPIIVGYPKEPAAPAVRAPLRTTWL